MEQRFVIPDFLPEEHCHILKEILERLQGENFRHYLEMTTGLELAPQGPRVLTLEIDTESNTARAIHPDEFPLGPALVVSYYGR